MKTKLVLLAALTLIGLGTTRTLIGSDGDKAAPSVTAAEASAAKSCCAMKEPAPAKKDAVTPAGMDCHTAPSSTTAAPKGCCSN